jgi:hypothetical protein
MPKMAAPNSSVVLPAFAKLQGETFVYFMRKYSITLGRNTETSIVDWDLSELGGGRGPRVSRHHARIFYDFEKHHFALEVLGRHGCSIRGFSYLPGSNPVKLNSQDLIEIAGKQFYFLLPIRPFFATPAPDAHIPLLPPQAHGECGMLSLLQYDVYLIAAVCCIPVLLYALLAENCFCL